MLSRFLMIVFAFAILLGGTFFFLSDSSYQNSLQSRVYYFLGNYQEAYDLAKSAHDEDSYNKMAFTVMTQSKIALKYEKYIEQGNEYFKTIDEISSRDKVTLADKSKVKLMCEIMMDEYQTLVPTPLTDEKLQINAGIIKKKFEQLYAELF